MSRPATGEPDGGGAAPQRTSGTRDPRSAVPTALVLVIGLGLAFRIILTYALPNSGFENDLGAFRGWAANLAAEGPFGFYERPGFHDYTPGYLYILWAIGVVGTWMGGIGDLIKIPAIIADAALAWVVWSMTRELGARRGVALLAAAIVIVNPITWFDSVVWGQVDSVGVVFLLLGLRELWRDRPERAAILTVIAAIVKPQLGILVPIVAAVTIRRALFPAGGYGDEPGPDTPGGPDRGSTTFDWERRVRGPIRIVTTGAAGLVTAAVLSAGFGLSIFDLLVQVGSAAGTYPYLTVNAYNPWALLQLDGAGLAANGQWVCDAVIPPAPDGPQCAAAFQFGPIPAVLVGTILLLTVVVVTSLLVARRPDRRTMLVGLAVLAIAFFVVPTRVHERYLYPFFAIGAILAVVSVRWRVAYIALSLATFANMYVVLTTLYPPNPAVSPVRDWLGIGPAIREPLGVTLIALVHLAGFVWAAAQLRDAAHRRLGQEIASASVEADAEGSTWTGDDADEQPGRRAAVPAPTGPGLAPAAAGPAAPRYRLPAWRYRPSLAEVGAIGWLRDRMADPPVRADRSATLRRERGGRFGRLDLWILIVLVLAAMTLRMWRLAEPYRMHFDEVYHARTATEFLQHWRYGLSHDIYEWTHPHLAKYAMAGGLLAFGGDHVAAESDLGVPVADALVEPRWEDLADRSARVGDRLHVATGTEVRSYDLHTRRLVAQALLPGAHRLELDPESHRLLVATVDGELSALDLRELDAARAAGTEPYAMTPQPLATLEAPARLLHLTEDGGALVAALERDIVQLLDPMTGAELARAEVGPVAAIDDAGTLPALVARPSDVPDPAAAAEVLAELLGGQADDYEAQLREGDTRVVVSGLRPSDEVRTAVDAAISEERLPGFAVETVQRLAFATPDGVAFMDSSDGEVIQTLPLDGGARGLALVEGIDDPRLYVTTTGEAGPQYRVITVGGDDAGATVSEGSSYPLPGPGSTVRWNSTTQHVHILGAPPEARPSDEAATVYVVEPHANAVYADAPLDFEPAAVVLDENELYPSSDRQDVLALSPDGTVASIDAGSHAFAWRLPGVIAGVLMAGLLYVLARMLFARRSVAVLVGALVLADGMLFVQSRIAMNDAYVALFIVAAYTLFAAIWTNAWRWRGAFWVAMPAIGLLLGLALSAKWVAAYAIGALGILILARSALGRVILIGGMIVVTTLLGYLAMSVPADTPPEAGWQILGFVLQGNLTFMLIMIGLTFLAALVAVLHPIAWSDDEVRFAVGAPAAAGVGLALVALAAGRMDREYAIGSLAVTPLQVAFVLCLLSLVVAAVLWLLGRSGFGPLAPPPAPDDPTRLLEPAAPAPEGWLRPGWLLGVPVAWAAVCLLAIPLVVYVASYIPWALTDNHVIAGSWPVERPGDPETLLELTGSMYAYHNNLSEPHAASSPWWAWPFDLKPVWFYQQSFAGGTAAGIYDAGTIPLWWLGVPAMAFCAWQAFRRRSLPLALITIGFACQWIPWARIDRAAFQYHYYTSLPFVILALAYFLAELWHGASRRAWLLARLAAAAVVVGPVLLWLFHRPLCGFVRVDVANPGSQACPTLIPDLVITARVLAVATVIGVSVLVLGRQYLARGSRRSGGVDRQVGDDRWAAGGRMGLFGEWGPIAISALVALGALMLALLFPDVAIVELRQVPVEPIAIIVALPLLALAAFVASARDARRFVIGMVTGIVAFAIVWYPNLSALPLPSTIFNAYQGYLPTYVFPFQFPVSTVDRSADPPPLLAIEPAILLFGLTVTSVILAYSAWVWRVALAERAHDERHGGAGPEAGTGPALGTTPG